MTDYHDHMGHGHSHADSGHAHGPASSARPSPSPPFPTAKLIGAGIGQAPEAARAATHDSIRSAAAPRHPNARVRSSYGASLFPGPRTTAAWLGLVAQFGELDVVGEVAEGSSGQLPVQATPVHPPGLAPSCCLT